MASGFLVLPDGRCFARRWSIHDAVLRRIVDELPPEEPLYQWLLSQLPTSADEEELGYGAWYRVSDGQVIAKHIDTRGLTSGNQALFCQAAKMAAKNAASPCVEGQPETGSIVLCLQDLGQMIAAMERCEPPLDLSDWRAVTSHDASRIGPGW